MPKQTNNTDPYAAPPMHHDRSGGVVRVALLAVMLGAAGLGYAWFSGQETTPLVPVAEEQQMADAGYDVAPSPVTLAPGELVGPLVLPGRSVRVAQTAGVIEQSIDGSEPKASGLALGQFEWRKTEATFILRNVGDVTIELVEFEFK